MSPWLAMLVVVQSSDSVSLCVRDAATKAPVVGATVRRPGLPDLVLRDACVRVQLSGEMVAVSRVGYRPGTVRLDGPADATHEIRLVPWSGGAAGDAATATATPLPVRRVTADTRGAARAGVVQAGLDVSTARGRGVVTMNGLITLLPYTTMRSSRGESGLSLRGARREQVVIMLDGMPLNDPATGLADVADLPLSAVQTVTVTPGADPIGGGSGASGGVLALSTGVRRLVTVRGGSFGQRAMEAAWTGTMHAARWNAAVSRSRALNDFAFVNDAGASAVRERRVNNDENRTVAMVGLVTSGMQWSGLFSEGTRGMVGPANVRSYDADRAHTSRALLRGQVTLGGTMLTAGARRFVLAYRNPSSPALDARANAWAADVEWRAAGRWGTWRVGSGADGLRGSGKVSQQRVRGFAAWGWNRANDPDRNQRAAIDVGVRADAIEYAGVQPSASAGTTWRLAGTPRTTMVSVLARGSQAMRVPTLYDLYFSSPQRLTVRALDPERVEFDGNGGVQLAHHGAGWRAVGEFSAVSRDTRRAIIWFPGNFGWSPANVGRERLRGTEGRIELTTASLTMHAWHTWYAAELRSGSLNIPTPYVPRHSAAVSAAWRVGAATLSGIARYQGPRPFTAGPRNPFFELPAVTITDVAWSHRRTVARADALLSLAIDNVTDVRWQSVRGFPMPGRGWSAALTLTPRP
jgi:outer membrane cobalamin receptor